MLTICHPSILPHLEYPQAPQPVVAAAPTDIRLRSFVCKCFTPIENGMLDRSVIIIITPSETPSCRPHIMSNLQQTSWLKSPFNMIASLSEIKCCLRWRPSWMPLFSFTTRKHIAALTLAILFAFIASIATPAFAVILGEIFNSFTLFGGNKITAGDLSKTTIKFCIGLAGLGSASWLFNGLYFITFVVFGELQVAQARCRLFEGLLRKNQEWFETQKDGSRAFLSGVQE